MTEIKNWSAGRSGAAITIRGQRLGGEDIKVTVKTMQPSRERPGIVVATAGDGSAFYLHTKRD